MSPTARFVQIQLDNTPKKKRNPWTQSVGYMEWGTTSFTNELCFLLWKIKKKKKKKVCMPMSVRGDELGDSQMLSVWPGLSEQGNVGVGDLQAGLGRSYSSLHPYKDKPAQISNSSSHLSGTTQLQKGHKRSQRLGSRWGACRSFAFAEAD